MEPAEADAPRTSLSTQHLNRHLRGHAVRGGVAQTLAEGLLVLIRFGYLIVLARLLTPRDFGLVAMALAFTELFECVRSAGLPVAIVQQGEVSQTEASTVFWVNAGLSLAVLLLFWFGSPVLAGFYGEESLIWIAPALAAAGFVDGLGSQHQALLRRQMRFVPLALSRIGASIASRLLAVGAALYGAGPWALVVQRFALATLLCGAVWLVCAWRPGLPRRGESARDLLTFGGFAAGAAFVRSLSRRLVDVLIGRFIGTASLGLYGRAYTLLNLPLEINGPIGSVATAALSRVQSEPDRYRAFYRKALLPTISVGMPLVLFLFLEAEVAVLTFLGPQWTEVVPVFRWLVPAAFVSTFTRSARWLQISSGRADREFRWWLIELPVQLGALCIGLPYGLVGAAIAVAATHLLVAPFKIGYAIAPTPITTRDVLSILWRPTLASVSAGLLATVLFRSLPALAPPVDFFARAGLYGALYAGLWVGLPGGLSAFRQLLRLRRELRPAATEGS